MLPAFRRPLSFWPPGPLHAALQALPVVTCVARVSEAHPGPGIPVTRRRDWRPSPDAAFGLIRATPGAGVIQPVGSRETRIAPTTPTVPNHQSPLSTDERPIIPNPESRIPNPESRIPNPESRIPRRGSGDHTLPQVIEPERLGQAHQCRVQLDIGVAGNHDHRRARVACNDLAGEV